MILRIATRNSSTWYPIKTTTTARGRSTRYSRPSWCTDKPAVAGNRGEHNAPARAGRRGEKVKNQTLEPRDIVVTHEVLAKKELSENITNTLLALLKRISLCRIVTRCTMYVAN